MQGNAFAPLLVELRDYARENYGGAYSAGLITGRVVVAGIKARALDLQARLEPGAIDGRAFALAVQAR